MTKACKDCLHYERYGYGAGICWHPETAGHNPIHGPTQYYALDLRNDGTCGPSGKLFEQAPPPTFRKILRSYFMVNDRAPY